jgi:Ca2+-binding RTX toxin-like protein
MPSAHDASGAVTRGVQLTFDEFGVLATDGWGGADTITGVEAFWLTGFDDVVTVSGDFGLSLASVTDPAIQLVIDAGQEELVGDTLILASSRMLNVDLAGSTASDETGTVIVSDFENVVGGDGADTIFGNGESNRLKGGLGADELYGLDGDDFLFFDADDIVVNGGAGRDVAFAQGGAGVTVDLDDCALDISRRHRTCRRPDRLRQRADAGGRRRGGCAEGGASGHHRTRDPLGRAGGGRSDQPCRPRIELAGAFPGGR